MSLHYTSDESYLYVNKVEIYKFKMHDNLCWYEFCVVSLSKDFREDEQIDISLNDTDNYFLVDHDSIERKYILNI